MNGIDVHGAWDETASDDECYCVVSCFKPTVSTNRPTKRKRFKRNVSVRQKKEVAYRQQYRCWFCKMLLLPSWQVDHFVPLWQGGSNASSNLVACCGNCHNEKTAIENDRRSPYFRIAKNKKKNRPNKPLQ